MQSSIDPREALSALLDGESSADADKFLARRLEHDPELAAQLGRWQFAGDVLRAASKPAIQTDLRASIREQIATEAAAQSRSTVAPAFFARNKRVFSGLAVAAALGIVALAVRPSLNSAPDAVVASDAAPPTDVVTEAPAVSLPSRVDVPVDSNTQVATSTPVQSSNTPTLAVANATRVKPWRVPEDADALIANANAAAAKVAADKAAIATSTTRLRNTARQGAAIAAVPKAINRSEDVERVLRGESEQGVLGVDPAAHPGWPRSVIPGIDSGAFNASFSSGGASRFQQTSGSDTQHP
ncbi:sigma-E factor negative regulatory protein [Lysobacter sp. HDW10]|uniref:sigma-E factor negative regulatory protein n=1 Tax=Lysobacter sp. HDW10 TaxID=2714936 RepID=UPI0014083FF4|nr:sigma-E factor negative regulatory protein [Lysobacter sp. HDW10]QIK81791.1 sigma-E factor negative regulatory protein [Lysobacter sp. HDW10]